MNPTECPICGTADKTAHRYPCTGESDAPEYCPRAGVDYEIRKAPDTGYMVVYADGAKIGQSQTKAAARLIRRNHSRAIERRVGNLG